MNKFFSKLLFVFSVCALILYSFFILKWSHDNSIDIIFMLLCGIPLVILLIIQLITNKEYRGWIIGMLILTLIPILLGLLIYVGYWYNYNYKLR